MENVKRSQEKFQQKNKIEQRSCGSVIYKKHFYRASNLTKWKKSLGIYEHEDRYLRCKGWLGKGKLLFDAKLPILLPNFHHFTYLVAQSAYEKLYQNGVKETLLEIRSKYWIPKVRQIIKRILNKMFVVQKIRKITVSITYSEWPAGI